MLGRCGLFTSRHNLRGARSGAGGGSGGGAALAFNSQALGGVLAGALTGAGDCFVAAGLFGRRRVLLKKVTLSSGVLLCG